MSRMVDTTGTGRQHRDHRHRAATPDRAYTGDHPGGSDAGRYQRQADQSVPLFPLNDVPKGGFFGSLSDSVLLMFKKT